MHFGLHFANLTFPDPGAAHRVARAAEAAGFESLITVEHVVWPTRYASRYPYAPDGRLPGGPGTALPDPLIWMAHVAAATTRLRLITGVLVVPQRNPLVLAKQVATLDHLSGGRVSLGIGVGWLREEFEALGVPFERRGARTDEHVAAMRALWASDDASFRGAFVRFEGMSSNPKPVHGAVPILVGGHSEQAARRAGRLGDGFLPATGMQGPVEPLIDLMRRAAAEAGRDPERVEITTGCPGALGDDPLRAVEEARARGARRVLVPASAFLPDPEAKLAAFGERVIRHARA
ncbi:MAG TPA: LLM class F420-dependent oxidoreductase [Methylomirabilota bacterium]|nr:LLM class F420-dependent oxidoreductase [Methylomirabilota bacterium]